MLQVAAKSCLTCFIKKPARGSVEEHMTGERGLYCDNCFSYQHDQLEKDLEKDTELSQSQKMERMFVEQSKTIKMVETGIRRHVETDHTWSHLMQPCEECEWRCAMWRCHDCKQVYCSKCLTGMHSLGGIFAKHSAEPLPYYTIDMHKRYQEDEMFHKNKAKMDQLMIIERVYTQKYKLGLTIKIQAWWRMCVGRKSGRKAMKDKRRLMRKAWKLRQREDKRYRNTLGYKVANILGMADSLVSDTREEQVMRSIPWVSRRQGLEFIWGNQDDWGFFKTSRTEPRKGVPRRGFTIGTIDELREQAIFGGARMPGYIHCFFGSQKHRTQYPLDTVISAGEYVRIQELLFVVLSVTDTHVTLDRQWPKALTEEQLLDRPPTEEGVEAHSDEVMFRLPSYRGQRGRRYYKAKYTIIRGLMGNFVFQAYFKLHAITMATLEARARDVFDRERIKGRIKGQQKALRTAMRYKRLGLWAENYITVTSEPVDLADALTPEQKEALKKEKERVKEGKRKEREALKLAAKAAKEEANAKLLALQLAAASKRSSMSAAEAAKLQAEADEAEAAAAAIEEQVEQAEEGDLDLADMNSDMSKTDDGLTDEQRMQKQLKDSGQMWLADDVDVETRAARYALMSEDEIIAESDDWREMVDVITENVYWLCEATMEKIHSEPKSIKLKRERAEKQAVDDAAKIAARSKLGKGAGSGKKKRKM